MPIKTINPATISERWKMCWVVPMKTNGTNTIFPAINDNVTEKNIYANFLPNDGFNSIVSSSISL